MKISPLAAVDSKATIADDVEIGPFCVVGPDVTIGAGTRLLSHVVIGGRTTIGTGNIFHPHAVIGGPPQDLSYKGELTGLEIGNGNSFREAVTINTGTRKGAAIFGDGITRIGNENLLMVNTHVGHDAQIGSNCVLANNVMIAGHIIIGDRVILNGGVGINAFVSIGRFAYIDGYSRIHHDVPPFVKATHNEVRAVNAVGMKRASFTENDIEALEDATRRLFGGRKKTFSAAMAEFDTLNGINPLVKELIEFLRRRDQGKFGRYLESLRKK